MSKTFKSRRVVAGELLADDKFKIAGTLYIVLSTEMSYGSLRIKFEPYVNTNTARVTYAMYVPTHMKFKIYNKR